METRSLGTAVPQRGPGAEVARSPTGVRDPVGGLEDFVPRSSNIIVE